MDGTLCRMRSAGIRRQTLVVVAQNQGKVQARLVEPHAEVEGSSDGSCHRLLEPLDGARAETNQLGGLQHASTIGELVAGLLELLGVGIRAPEALAPLTRLTDEVTVASDRVSGSGEPSIDRRSPRRDAFAHNGAWASVGTVISVWMVGELSQWGRVLPTRRPRHLCPPESVAGTGACAHPSVQAPLFLRCGKILSRSLPRPSNRLPNTRA